MCTHLADFLQCDVRGHGLGEEPVEGTQIVLNILTLPIGFILKRGQNFLKNLWRDEKFT
jgi:hypothetical protein